MLRPGPSIPPRRLFCAGGVPEESPQGWPYAAPEIPLDLTRLVLQNRGTGIGGSEVLPPHFHAKYAEHRAKIRIDTLEATQGALPRRAHALVLEWAAIHRTELWANWHRAREGLPLEQIPPLE